MNVDGKKAEKGFEMNSDRISLFGANSVIGRSLVISKSKDDYGTNKKNKQSTIDGNSGPPLACGIIAWKNVSITAAGWETYYILCMNRWRCLNIINVLLVYIQIFDSVDFIWKMHKSTGKKLGKK